MEEGNIEERLNELENRVDGLERDHRRQKVMKKILYAAVLLYIIVVAVIYSRILGSF